MKVYAVRATDTYTRISNSAARDAELSFKARGILTYLLSHAEGFNLSVAALRGASTDGKDSIASGIHELEARGYLVRVRLRTSGGRLGAVSYAVSDDPALLVAEDVAERIGGQVVAAQAAARYRAGNPQNTPAFDEDLAENPPMPENPPMVSGPGAQRAPQAENPPKHPTKPAIKAENPPKRTAQPKAGFPAPENPAALEDQGKEKNRDNNNGVVVGHQTKAPSSPAKPLGGEGLTAEASERAEALSVARRTFKPTTDPAPVAAEDMSLPSANGRAPLPEAERWGLGAFVAAWDGVGLKLWSADDADLARHALTYWTQAEIVSVLSAMARGRRDIKSPLRYFAGALEKKAREVRRPAARQGTPKAAQLTSPAPAAPVKTAPKAELDLDDLPPEVRAAVKAKMAEMAGKG